ncbi:Ig-like domain-containing protein [uncultured Flavobacterium sp.]|uniref:Ig-like domain-containing protein n=1 Tax=uncultured Flavobacterium sp. TaxID=165435 RepID=UPI00292E9AC8|nr:Ig-like domain-containing protein [uncultured Flavobacterium sp.]
MIRKLLYFIVFFFSFLFSYGQSASNYCFSARSGTYTALTGATSVSGLAATDDDAISNSVAIPFNFLFGGSAYNQMRVSSNGWLSFGNPSISNNQNYNNTSNNAGQSKPILFPLWDDLQNRTIPRYVVTGSAPNRIFKLEWSQQEWDFNANNDVISFQVWLYETTNVIEYYYTGGATPVSNGSASIGIYDSNDTFLTLNNSTTAPTAQSSTFNANINSKPANGQIYSFTPPVTVSQAGPDQYKTTPFTLAANTPGSGNTGTWSIVSGPNLSTSQFASGDTSNPTSTFTPSGSGTWVLNWTITNGCGTSTDQVIISNCSGNLITNGDFSSGAAGWTPAVNSKGPSSSTSYVEVLNESVYFNNGNNDNTAELDKEASLGQTVAVIPGVTYTLSFLYARRPLSPATVAVDVRIYEGGSITATRNITTSDNTSTPQVGTLTFTPSSSSIVLEFYNSLGGTSTLGSIVDNIVLIPSSQVAPVATTTPKGSYKTLTACSGASVQLDVDNISASGVTYLWSGSAAATFSSTTIKNPTVTFSSSGVIEKVTVVATTAGGCSGSSSSTYVNVLAAPTITTAATPAVVTAVCQSVSTTTMTYTGTTNSPTSYSIDWATLTDQGSTAFTFLAGGGSLTGISIPAGTTPGNYSGTMTIKNANGCTATQAITMTINPNASIVSVTGTSPLCIGGTATYSANTVVLSGGTGAWSSSNTAIATVNASGLVTGVSAGTANIIYTITGGCGGTVSSQQSVTVNPNASIVSVTGTSPLCIGGTATYSANTVVLSGGTGAWSSSNTAIATVNASGLVTGVSAGTANIIYTITGGCGGTKSAQQSVTINPNASIVSVTGTSPLCIGGTATYSANTVVLSGGTGAWSSSNTAIATVNASGLVTGVSAGTANIIYTITGGCGGTVSSQQSVTINPNASIVSVTGTSPLCIGGTATYSANTVVLSGGTGAWSSSNTAIATVNASGLVTGVSAGTANIIYTITGGCGGTVSSQQSVTINPNASIVSVTGTSPLCIGGTATYSANTVVLSGGTGAWSSSNTAIATVNASGLVTGVSAGTANIIYTITGGCGGTKSAQQSVTINPNASIVSVTGTSPLCIGGTATYSANTVVLSGGTGAWSSSNTAIATVNASGLVTGVSAGTANIIYTITGGCGGTVSSQQSVTINPNASIVSVTGTSPLCIGGTATYSANTVVLSGGTGAWSSSNTAIATVNASGLVTGVSAGTANIIYTITGGCGGTVSSQQSVTINPNASIVSVTGTSPLCIGGTATYSANTVVLSGGTGAWSSSNTAIATVNASGLVTGVSAGTANIIYSITGGCGGTVSSQQSVTINPNASIVSVTGTSPLCIGGTATYSANTIVLSGGTGAWSSSNTAIATVNASGLVTGVSAGTANIIYTITGGCGGTVSSQQSVTINPNASIVSVTGTSPLCIGGTATYSANTVVLSGGTGAWSSSNTAIATVNASGLVTGVSAGIANIIYTITGGCGGTKSAQQSVTINPNASIVSVTGTSPLCIGGTATYSANTVVLSGGTGAWSSSNTAIATVNASGLVTGVSAGTANIIYTITGGCGGTVSSQQSVTINPNASIVSVTGTSPLCIGGTATYSANTVILSGGTGAWSSSNTAIATVNASGLVTGVSAGTANIIYTITGGCGGTKSAQQSVTINPNLPVSVSIAVSPSTTICSGTSVTFTATPANGGSAPFYQWKLNGTNVGSNSATYTNAALTNGDIVTCAMTSNAACVTGNPATSNALTITVNPSPSTPTPGTPTQPTCASQVGSVVLSNLPATGTWKITQSGSFPATYSSTGSTYTVQNLAVGTYFFTVENSNTCTSLISSAVVINAAVSIVWTGNADGNWNNPANWNTATVPTASDCILIPDVSGLPNAPTVQGTGVTANAYAVNVGNNGSLTVNSSNTLKVVGSVIVSASGSLVFNDSASLVQTTNAVNTGNITYLRNTEPVRRYDFTYWSAPITNSAQPYTLHDLSPNTLFDKYASYNPLTGSWVYSINGTQVMTSGIGYWVRAPQPYSTTVSGVYTATFKGVPNNGDYAVQVHATKWSLIGNPYPSAVDAEKFITMNHDATPSVDVGALYFWTHNSSPVATGTGTYAYTSNDFAVYTLSGGTGTGGAKLPDGTFGPPPTGKIAACQGFFMNASGPNDVMFTNAMRIDGQNDKFYKTSKSNTLEKNRIWLNLTNSQNAFKQILVGYIEGATNSWDINYDAVTMNGNSFIDFYSINDASKLAIQGRALPFENTDKVPLGYKTTVAGDFTIAIDRVDGLFDKQAIYLEDKTTGIVTDLRAGNYTFTTAIGTFVDRFILSYTKKTLGTGDFENLDSSVFVSVNEKAIKVTSTKETIKEVTIYDITGNLLYNKKKVGTTELQITNLQSSNQVLLVKVVLDNDFTTTKKVIFQ